ncbi:MAG: YcxB family protein [Eubacterium sp.]|nr:YcxB family protein [Eubacterium sp.]
MSEMKYQVKMTYDREDIAALVRTMEFRRHPEKNVRMARKIGFPVFGLAIIAAGISLPVLSGPTVASIVFAACCALLVVILIRRSDSRGMERRTWKQYPNKGLVLTYTFYNDHFEEEDEVSGKHEFQYLSIKNGNLDNGHFFLFTTGNMAHMLKRNSFVIGEPDSFAKFIHIRAAVTLDSVE